MRSSLASIALCWWAGPRLGHAHCMTCSSLLTGSNCIKPHIMEMVGGKEYFGIIVHTAKAVGSSTSHPSPSSNDTVSSSTKHPSRTVGHPSQTARHPSRTVGSPSRTVGHPSQTVGQRNADLPEYIRKLEEEMLQHLSKKREGEPKLLYRTRWYRLTDSGGQPQFLEVIPIFIHNISLGIIVIMLNKRLDCFPMIEFYEDGKSVGELLLPGASCQALHESPHIPGRKREACQIPLHWHCNL